MIGSKTHKGAWLAAAATLAIPIATASSQTPPPAATTEPEKPAVAPSAEAPPPGYWINGIHLSAQLDAGFNLNPMRPSTGLNFGQLFTDHANQATLNQLLLTANKPLDPKDTGFQWGFKLQAMYGSDARYTQFLGEFNRVTPGDRYQLDVVEANLLFHLPVLTEGGIDLKAGQYSTPLGYETIDPSTNPFYSHSYIFQFGLPFKHTGALTTTHVNEVLDIYAGLDTGSNTTFGPLGENNSAIGGIAGLNLTLMGGNLTILALTHMGPDQPSRVLAPLGYNADGKWRYYNDIVVTYKANDNLTLVTELNAARDDFGYANKPANAFGAAQYVSYTLNDQLTLNARAELWRDDNNFFVASFSGNNDPVRFQQGLPLISNAYIAPGGSTTYGGLSFGVAYKPPVTAPITSLLIRPEVRWDRAFTNNNPFNQNPPTNSKGVKDTVTFAADAVITF